LSIRSGPVRRIGKGATRSAADVRFPPGRCHRRPRLNEWSTTVTVLARLHRDQVRSGPEGTHLTLAQHDLLIPPLLARLVTDLSTGQAATTSRAVLIDPVDDEWLFPGFRPGTHVTAEYLAERLRTPASVSEPDATPR